MFPIKVLLAVWKVKFIMKPRDNIDNYHNSEWHYWITKLLASNTTYTYSQGDPSSYHKVNFYNSV